MTILGILKNIIDTRSGELEKWFEEHSRAINPLIYSSVDIRHSGLKLCPVDVNAFPGGFNNLSPTARQKAAQYFKAHIDTHYPATANILLIPENHTRNAKYLENVQVLHTLLREAGFSIRLASVGLAEDGAELPHEKPVKANGTLKLTDGFQADLVILNNDLTSGNPSELRGLSIPVLPHQLMGWHNRKKSSYFYHYDKLAKKFAGHFGFDPWLITTFSEKCIYLNFKEKKGLECAGLALERIVSKTNAKFREYDWPEEPYVFIKAESGTYGMGIMTAKTKSGILDANKNARKKMNVIKEGMVNAEVIIQEGVKTIDHIEQEAAEPMVYLVGGKYVGGAYRINRERGEYGNMNGPGMTFKSLDSTYPDGITDYDSYLAAVTLISELASLAAAYEKNFYKEQS